MNSTRDRIDAESRKDPERLEREIDQQRDNIGQIVSALESKLSPGELIDRFIGAGNGTGGEFARSLGNVVKANPVPTILTAAGLAWLYACRNETPATRRAAEMEHSYSSVTPGGSSFAGSASAGSSQGAGEGLAEGLKERAAHLREGVSETWSNATSRVGEAAHGVGSKVGSMAQGIGNGASSMVSGVRSQTQRLGVGYSTMLQENPMAAGAIAIAAGALIGALLPITQPENRLMGKASDKLKSKASDIAQTVRSKGGEMAQELSRASGGGQDDGQSGQSSSGQNGQGGSGFQSGASSSTGSPGGAQSSSAPQASI
ncbi:MAG TPA: DUF3618 domain-containing protein [Pseudoxanthomonas sp.]|nr:DUF3618 domain-containing protein [Pseudoxanthomonas sp.]